MNTEPRKQAICDALRTWINQRPGFDPNNYDRTGYLSDSRTVQRQARDARELLRAVELSSITADALIAAFSRAFSGRLQMQFDPAGSSAAQKPGTVRISYCTGQYWCTEYRAAACAVLASALWKYTREECMPPPEYRQHGSATKPPMCTEAVYGPLKVSAGEWLRFHFRQQFGRGIASRWFS